MKEQGDLKAKPEKQMIYSSLSNQIQLIVVFLKDFTYFWHFVNLFTL